MIIKRSFSKPVLALFSVFLVTIVFFIGYTIGAEQRTRSLVPSGEGRVVGLQSVDSRSKDVEFAMFWDVWNLVKETYYKQPVSDKDLYYGALKGMVEGTGNPYTTFFNPEETKSFLSDLEQSFEGIGAEIGIKEDRLQVVAPLKGSPSEQAGLQPGDWIVTIDGTETIDMSVEKAVSLIRGKKGTVVKLEVSREGLDELKTIEITRDKIIVDSVKWEIDDKKIMTISISTFNGDTVGLFNQAVQDALTKDVKGIIVDVRNNPGGLLTTAVDIASSWTGYQPVLLERSKDKEKVFPGIKQARLEGVKTVILVNGGSASASEIFAGALQDYGFATLVGTQTFGKGSVQDYRQLPDGSSVKITTAEWFTPKGRGINETGITPDIEVSYSIEQLKDGIDPQQETAVSILLGTYQAKADGEIDSK